MGGGGEIKNKRKAEDIAAKRGCNETASDAITTTTAVSLKKGLILKEIR